MIAVIGATGFVGTALTTALVATGEPVRALVRHEQRARDRLTSTHGGVALVQGDMRDPSALDRLLDGARAVYVVVQTVTAPQTAGAGDFATVERDALEQIVLAARRAGVRRLLTVGLIGARTDAANAWVRSRAEQEQHLLVSGLDVTVLRAGLVAGVGSVGFDGILAAASRRLATIRGGGRQQWSYIALADLVGYLVEALDEQRTVGRVLDVGSLESPTYRALVARTAVLLGHPVPTLVGVPLGALRLLAPMLERRQGLAPGGLRTAIGHLGDDLVGDPMPIRRLLPRTLLDWDGSVRAAVSSPAPGGHAATVGP